jgi:hypothetical protein
MTPYLLLADLLATYVEPDVLSNFRASDDVRTHFYALLEKEKMGLATSEEVIEIEQFMSVEHILQLAKAKIKQHAGQ